MCIMFWNTSSESHCFCLKPTTQCTFTELILCSINCLNVYNVLKNFFRKPLLLIEAHHSLYFQWARTSFNCMFECVYCFEKLLLKAIASAWSPPLGIISQSAYFVQLYVCMCIMFWKTSSASRCFCFKPTTQCTFTERIICLIVCMNVYNVRKSSSESHCFCLKPNTQCTFTERILCSIVCLLVYIVSKDFFWTPLFLLEAHHSSYFVTLTERTLFSIVCLNVNNVLKTFFWKPLILLEAHHSMYFHRAHTLFNCMFECV